VEEWFVPSLRNGNLGCVEDVVDAIGAQFSLPTGQRLCLWRAFLGGEIASRQAGLAPSTIALLFFPGDFTPPENPLCAADRPPDNDEREEQPSQHGDD
jgi:hypothetical protein